MNRLLFRFYMNIIR